MKIKRFFVNANKGLQHAGPAEIFIIILFSLASITLMAIAPIALMFKNIALFVICIVGTIAALLMMCDILRMAYHLYQSRQVLAALKGQTRKLREEGEELLRNVRGF